MKKALFFRALPESPKLWKTAHDRKKLMMTMMVAIIIMMIIMVILMMMIMTKITKKTYNYCEV